VNRFVIMCAVLLAIVGCSKQGTANVDVLKRVGVIAGFETLGQPQQEQDAGGFYGTVTMRPTQRLLEDSIGHLCDRLDKSRLGGLSVVGDDDANCVAELSKDGGSYSVRAKDCYLRLAIVFVTSTDDRGLLVRSRCNKG
jgi:hypothetical protein